MALIVWVHNLVYRLVFGLVRFGLGMLWRWVLVIVALLGEEVRRYAGLALSGAVIVGFGKLTLSAPVPDGVKRWLVLFLLVMLAVWAGAVRRAVRFTRHNSLLRVKYRQQAKALAGDVHEIRGRVTEGLAKATQGTPMGGAFRSNREATAKAEADARTAADRAAAERDAQARRAAAAAAEQRRLDALGPDHDPYATTGRYR